MSIGGSAYFIGGNPQESGYSPDALSSCQKTVPFFRHFFLKQDAGVAGEVGFSKCHCLIADLWISFVGCWKLSGRRYKVEGIEW